MGRAGRGGNGNRELAGIERGETNYKRRVITTVSGPHISNKIAFDDHLL